MSTDQNKPRSLDLSDDVISYYDNLIKKIKTDFKNGLHDQAIDRCYEELNQPYLPFEYIVEFENLANQLEIERRYQNIEDHLKKLSQPQMLHEIYDGKMFKIHLFDYFLNKFHATLGQNDFDAFQFWLNSSILSNVEKFYIFDSLAHYKINRDFIFKNTIIHDDIVLNTLSFHDHPLFSKYNIAYEIIEKQLFKDPIVSKFAIDLLDAVANNFFPSFPFSSADRLADIILKIIHASMNFVELDYEKLSDDERKVYNIFLEFQNLES